MLQHLEELMGKLLVASDGEIGRVEDFYFDDKNWVIRYLVANTGSWLTGRQVIIAPHSFGTFDRVGMAMHVSLTKQQIEKSPSIDKHKPVSRQFEIEYYQHYGLPAYWNGDAMWGFGSYPYIVPLTEGEAAIPKQVHHREDKHLRSALAVKGYDIQTVDGTIGHVTDFMVDDRSWVIEDLIIETGSWLQGKEVLVPTGKVGRISYEESKVFIGLTKQDILRTGEHAIAHHTGKT